jgi:monoamine oxidase
MDDTKPDGSFPALMGFLLSTHAREWAGKSREERQLAITRQYCDLLQDERALHPVHYVEKDWNAEEFSGGCYVASPKPGTFRNAVPSLRSAHGAVLFAGTETAVIWAGYMDGAVRAGERAAKQALARLDGASDAHVDSIGEDAEQPSRVLVARPARPTLLERGLALLFAGLVWLRQHLLWAPRESMPAVAESAR